MPIPLNSIQIVNRVMNQLGRLGVAAASNDSYAALISERLPDDVVYMLSQDSWYFATKFIRDESPAAASPVVPNYKYAYYLPFDFLQFYKQLENLNYQTYQGFILSSAPFIQYFYVYNLTDYTKFRPWFTEALVWYIVNRVALPLTQNINVAKIAEAQFEKEIYLAKTSNKMESPIFEAPYNSYNRGIDFRGIGF